MFILFFLPFVSMFLHHLSYSGKRSPCYSFLKASTGFLVAAYQFCQLTVSSTIADTSKYMVNLEDLFQLS